MNKVNTNSETIVDDNGIEIIVGYEFEKSPSQIEEGHGLHEVGCMIETTLHSVEVVIAGVGLDVLLQLTENQKASIVSKLTYE